MFISVLIPCKYFIILHIIDVQMNHIARDVIGSHLLCDIFHLTPIHITPSGLLIAKCPFLRQRACACQICIEFNHLRHILTKHEIIIKIAFICTKPEVIFRFLTHIKPGFIRSIKENTVSITAT